MRSHRVVVIGAGIAGLAAALDLAVRGCDVTVVERAAAPGGKMRQVEVGNQRLDAGPTVFTMRWVFEEIFAHAGTSLAAHLSLQPLEILARHAWSEREQLDLYADAARSADAIHAFAGPAEAQRYRDFAQRAQQIYQTLERPFLRSARPTPLALVRSAGFSGLGNLWRIEPFATMWNALGEFFHDPRLRQLFARYATYCGSSPFLAPATLMLIAHVERDGVWLVEGGMHRVAAVMAALAVERGAAFRYATEAQEIMVGAGRVAAVRLATGERLPADAVVVNADTAAIAAGRFGGAVTRSVPAVDRAARSLSAVTWSLVARTRGFPLLRHTVFFSGDYAAEFRDLFERSRLPSRPTVYVCAQDRGDDVGIAPQGPERLLCLVNAPATGDARSLTEPEIQECEKQTFELLEHCGLQVERKPEASILTTPTEFDQLFPSTGGALYGSAAHGWQAAFRRPGARSKVPGLYLAGGSVHPGPGVPMAALSGRLAASILLADLASTSRSRRGATLGGTSTP